MLVRLRTKLPMSFTDTPSRAFEEIQIDLVGPLPTIKSGKQYILTWQDCLTKYSGAIQLCITDAPNLAIALAEHFICRFGCP